jgi:hypothetical protein
MATGSEAAPPEPDGLQFDHAEFEKAPSSTLACAACKRPILDHYYEINGTIFCEPCTGMISTHLRGGSGFVRFLRALLFGTGAGAAGSAIYTLFIQTTRVDFSLVSILVGYLVGRAVRAGSRNRGGLAYQLLAVLLTYLAIGATHASRAFLTGNTGLDPDDPVGLPFKALLFAFFTVIAPVLNAQRSVISIAIVGFALWQAWKMNVRLKVVLTGPYQVGEAGPAGAIQGAPAHA